MAVTYEPIATNTVTGSTVASVTFSSIPSTYTDLVLVSYVRVTKAATTNDDVLVTLNGVNTGDLYSNTYAYGSGSTAGSGRVTSRNSGYWLYSPAANATSGVFETNILNLMNYSNTTTFKSGVSKSASMSDSAAMRAVLWRSTAAINSIAIATSTGSVYFVAGTSFSLYGIKAA
jgi:hypothetical protein